MVFPITMCGIFGYVGFLSQADAWYCVDLLAHRGPDGRGLLHRENITLGHRRLSILDLSPRARQPMSYGAGRYWITYNGEVYNFIELRRDLEGYGHSFQSDSDTEVILAAFVQWGAACLDRFNGMWALAIWDSQEEALFLARDRFGKKPLFYAHLPEGFAFASEMKALCPLLPEVRPNVDLVRDPQRLFLYESTAACLIRGIERFPAGHWGRLQRGRLSLQRWWHTLDQLVAVPERYEEQVEQFRELFFDACRLRLRSDVPIGTALSGGLDSSSTLAALAQVSRTSPGQRQTQDWQHAFVACFPGTPLDESRYARLVTDHLGITATFIEIDPLAGLARQEEYFYLFEELYLTSPIPFMLTYGAMPAAGVKVTIDGHGADETFAGYPWDILSAFADAGLRLADLKVIAATYWGMLHKDPASVPPAATWKLWLSWLADRLRQGLSRRRQPRPQGEAWERLDHLNKTLYQATHRTVLPTLLRNYDRYSMAQGVEIRMPFMDYRLITWAFSVPWTTKLRRGFSKAVVRDALAPFLPPEVTYRKSKIGFNAPIVDWLKGPLKTFFLDTIHCAAFQSCDLINPAETAQTIRQVLDNPQATFGQGEQAWMRLSPYLWEQAVIKHRYALPSASG